MAKPKITVTRRDKGWSATFDQSTFFSLQAGKTYPVFDADGFPFSPRSPFHAVANLLSLLYPGAQVVMDERPSAAKSA